MNSFDLVVFLALVFAIVSGFRAGLLRTAVTILAYLIAMPTAVFLMTSGGAGVTSGSPLAQSSPLLFGTFLVTGIVLAKLMRMALDDAIGSESGIADRLAGAALGALRTVLVATTFVLIFDQLAPPGRQPLFLAGSQLRPLLSAAGQRGFNSLPGGLVTYVDRLKQNRRI